MANPIIDNAAGPTGTMGILIGKYVPDNPSEVLIFFSTILVICQLVHWGYKFYKWMWPDE